ncbi:PrsW family intramembrane metalloprotease [Dehalococcoides mccartyi]|uniref:PrsW family intramembrane metalloprotease n=2 Tax=Dehalococcoides mccartyi TaxID=61435 RepID=UPI00006B7239|nr:PrsW family intramembrane metalloprotease [Dehalococcoides mccartyi]
MKARLFDVRLILTDMSYLKNIKIYLTTYRWTWVLIGGLGLFLGAEQLIKLTHGTNFLPLLVVLGAFIMPVTFVVFIYERLPLANITIRWVLASFFVGGMIGLLMAGMLEYATGSSLSPAGLLRVGVIEEAAKLIFPFLLFWGGGFRAEANGVLFGVAAGMGFAALETMGYGVVSLIQSQGDINLLEQVLLFRGLLSPAGHAAWTGIVCAILWRQRAEYGRGPVNMAVIGAFILAVGLHIVWDIASGLNLPVVWAVIVLLTVAVLSLLLLIRAIRHARYQLRRGNSTV